MGKIILLDESTINKIAAGEVIERPSSIVKELVENSIDAKAASIIIEINDGGKSYINVTDNGTGIDEEDIMHVFERHATSKISNSKDLFNISSLGFRGEAMASIAAISEVEMQTKSDNSPIGHLLIIKGGKIVEGKSAGFPLGTSITVRNLFFNTPARLKFLKSDTTEQGYIVDMVEKLAITNTAISFKLIVNGKTVLHTPGNGDLLSVVQCVYGKNVVKSLIPIDYGNDFIKIDGYIGKPELTKGNSTYMFFSANKRVIKNKMMGEAVRQAYKTLLMNNRYPFSIINIDIQKDRLDVNVHPTKQEVKFSDDRAVFNTVYIAVKNCLNTASLAFNIGIHKEEQPIAISATYKNEEKVEYSSFFETKSNISEPIKIEYQKSNYTTDITKRDNTYLEKSIQKQETNSSEKKIIVGQLFNTYIIAQDSDNFYMIDQHAAHERIMYEYLLEKYTTGSIAIQQLMLPVVIELTAHQKSLYEANMSVFARLGFEIEWFGESTIAIRALPIIMGQPCSGDFFNSIMDTLINDNSNIQSPADKIIIEMACKNAIKAGDVLSIEEMNELVDRLYKQKNPYTCPHGRPTIIVTKEYELEKRFKRII